MCILEGSAEGVASAVPPLVTEEAAAPAEGVASAATPLVTQEAAAQAEGVASAVTPLVTEEAPMTATPLRFLRSAPDTVVAKLRLLHACRSGRALGDIDRQQIE